MHAKVLVVEDVREMSDLIALFLRKEGMEVRPCETGEEALQALDSGEFDLIVLDLNLPGIDGFEFLEDARQRTDCPVLVVTARGADEDLIAGLSRGADEYMTKPFSPKVLVARARALLRRYLSPPSEMAGRPASVSFGPFSLDLNAYELRKDDELVPLSVKEFCILRHLVERGDVPQTPKEIYDAVWKREYGDLTAVAVYIQRLRRKIEKNPSEPEYIETVHGRGYRFSPARKETE